MHCLHTGHLWSPLVCLACLVQAGQARAVAYLFPHYFFVCSHLSIGLSAPPEWCTISYAQSHHHSMISYVCTLWACLCSCSFIDFEVLILLVHHNTDVKTGRDVKSQAMTTLSHGLYTSLLCLWCSPFRTYDSCENHPAPVWSDCT